MIVSCCLAFRLPILSKIREVGRAIAIFTNRQSVVLFCRLVESRSFEGQGFESSIRFRANFTSEYRECWIQVLAISIYYFDLASDARKSPVVVSRSVRRSFRKSREVGRAIALLRHLPLIADQFAPHPFPDQSNRDRFRKMRWLYPIRSEFYARASIGSTTLTTSAIAPYINRSLNDCN